MILDKIDNAALYKGLGDKIAKGLEYIESTDLAALAVGKYDIGDGIKAIISEYSSKEPENAKIEAHKKFIDIQYIISGEEHIGYLPLGNQPPVVEYNEEKDVVFFDEEVSLNKLKAGMFAIYYPVDIHQPCVKIGASSPVKKLVLKVPVE